MEEKKEKFFLSIVFLVLGISSIILQVVLTRELLTLFGGNELIIGLVLFFWLLGSGIGSLVGTRKFKLENLIFISYLLFGLFVLSAFVLIRFIPSLLSLSGQIIPFSWAFFVLPLALLPTCFILGFQFKLFSQFFSQHLDPDLTALITNKAYLLECLGFVVGGLVFNFLLVYLLGLKVLIWVIILNLLVISTWCLMLSKPPHHGLKAVAFWKELFPNPSYKDEAFWSGGKKIWFISTLFLVILLLVLSCSPFLPTLNFKTLKWRFPGQEIIKTLNSPYANITVIKKDKEFNFFSSGFLISPIYNPKEAEETVHLPLLNVQQLKNILIIGGAWNGLLKEVFKYQPREIVYLEFDQKFVEILREYLPDELRQDLNQSQVNLITQDAITFLKESKNQKYEVIILDEPPPANFLLNRYYTEEFFKLIKNNLKEDGVFSFNLPVLAESVTNKNQNLFLSSIYQPLKNIFSSVIILPADQIYFLASNKNLNYDPQIVIDNFQKSQIKTSFLSAQYINYLYTQDKVNDLKDALSSTKSFQNKNFEPFGFLYYNNFYTQIFRFPLSKIYNFFLEFRWWLLGVITSFILLVLKLFFKDKTNKKLFLSMALASGSLIVLEIIIIILWQITYGYVYRDIALILSLIMTGLCLGNFTILKLEKYSDKFLKIWLNLLFLIIIFFTLLTISNFIAHYLLLVTFSLLTGFLVGGIFPQVNKLYLLKVESPNQKTGTIYGVELTGTAFLILLFNLFLIPIFGLKFSLGYLLFLNLFMFI